jgi:ABC-2 type transport system ATP-binding protein
MELQLGSEHLHPLNNHGVFCEDVSRGFVDQFVIQHLSLVAVPGQIFVLLGSSSSGKSTLLRTLIGELVPESGRVCVAGLNPADGLVGPLLGVMPQESGLFADLSVMENLIYFGRLNRMDPEEVESSYEILKAELDLAEEDAIVGQLSRGAQQMISFCIAIQHNPTVLILDEVSKKSGKRKKLFQFFFFFFFFFFLIFQKKKPNVGLDVLRNKRIWNVLRSRARDEQCTVLVFSHNVDDTRNADRVGFLRAGRLLAEGKPRDLCQQYRCRSLDAVFTALCLQDDQSFLPIVRKMDNRSTVSASVAAGDEDFRHFEAVSESSSDDDEGGGAGGDLGVGGLGDGGIGIDGAPLLSSAPLKVKPQGNRGDFAARARSEWRGWTHLPAVLVRHLHSLRRSWLLLLFQIAVPMLLAIMFLVFVGHTPMRLNVAVVNQDSGPLGIELANIVNVSDLLETKFYTSLADAQATITQPDGALAIFVIPSNFTANLNELMAHPAAFASDFVNVTLFLDYGDYQVTTVIEDKLEKSLQILLKTHYGTSMRLYDTEAIYGSPDTQYGETRDFFFFVCLKKKKKKKSSPLRCCWLSHVHCVLFCNVCDGAYVFLGTSSWLSASRILLGSSSLGACVFAHARVFHRLHCAEFRHDCCHSFLFQFGRGRQLRSAAGALMAGCNCGAVHWIARLGARPKRSVRHSGVKKQGRKLPKQKRRNPT